MVYRYNPYASAVYYGGNDYRDYIAHFRLPGTPNKDHKYIKKIGEGAKAVYIYATNAAKNVGRSVGKFVDNNITGSTYKRNATAYGARALSAYDKAKEYGANKLPLNQHESESEAKDYAKKASDEMAKYRKTLAGRLTSAIDKTRSSFRAAKTLVGNVLGKIGGTLSSIGSGILGKGRSIVSSILGAPSVIKGKMTENKQHKAFEKSVKKMTKTASKAPKKKKAVGEVFGSTPLASPYSSALTKKSNTTTASPGLSGYSALSKDRSSATVNATKNTKEVKTKTGIAGSSFAGKINFTKQMPDDYAYYIGNGNDVMPNQQGWYEWYEKQKKKKKK